MFDRQHHTLFEVRSVLLFAALTMGSTSALMAQSTALPALASSDQEISAAFTRADKNADKALSAEEAKTLPAVSQQFTQIDANGDGAISLAEFRAAMKDPKS
jgi:Ca2+-binding EF-hand superfamily protein